MFVQRRDVPSYLKEKFGLTVAVATLDKWFTVGGGPPCTHFGRKAYYEDAALDQWAAQKLSVPRRSSSEVRRPSSEAA